MTKNKQKSIKITICEIVYSIIMLLTALGVLKIPEIIFNVMNGAMLIVLALATIAWIVMAIRYPIDLAVSYKNKEKENNFSIKKFLYLVTIWVCLMGWSKLGPTFEFILYLTCILSFAVKTMQYIFKRSYYV